MLISSSKGQIVQILWKQNNDNDKPITKLKNIVQGNRLNL